MLSTHPCSRFYALVVFALLMTVSCSKESTTQSDSKGHYEETDAAAMTVFQNQQKVVPEYAKSSGVIVSSFFLGAYRQHQLATDMINTGSDHLWVMVPIDFQGSIQDPDYSELRQLLGSQISKVSFVKLKDEGVYSVWSRDWAPLSAESSSGKLRLLDFNYYSDRPADDSTPRTLEPLLGAERISIPVYNEGGNFMIDGKGNCLMTEKILLANSQKNLPNDTILNKDEIAAYYKTYAGCSAVYFLPRMPYETTGHIDMWAKLMNDNTIIVSELREEILQLTGYSNDDKVKLNTIRGYLDTQAKVLENLGYEIIRVPMPAPIFNAKKSVFRSYTNSLLLNNRAFVPVYVKPFAEDDTNVQPYIDALLLTKYNKEAEQTYTRLGFIFNSVVSDTFIAHGGAVHCATMQIAR